jgi:hypothetical protein
MAGGWVSATSAVSGDGDRGPCVALPTWDDGELSDLSRRRSLERLITADRLM